MTTRATHKLTRDQARRIAVQAALFGDDRPDDLLDATRRLTMLPLDQTRAVAPAAELVLLSRLGHEHQPGDLDDAIAAQRVIEVNGGWRSIDDVALYRAEMVAWPTPRPWKEWHHRLSDWMAANEACRQDVLERLGQDGPLPVCSLPPLAEAEAELDRRQLSAYGVARAGAVYQRGEPVGAGDAGEAVVVEGVRGQWRVDPTALQGLDRPALDRTELLAPFDLLLHHRKRMTDLLDFDYTLEMYKPKEKRRWGYYALPVLHGDRLVGKVDVTADHVGRAPRARGPRRPAVPGQPALRCSVQTHGAGALARPHRVGGATPDLRAGAATDTAHLRTANRADPS